jgi:hypothetical protein
MVRREKLGRSKNEDLYPRRVLLRWPDGRLQVAYEPKLYRFRELKSDDYLNTADLQQYFECSARTIYRWIAEEGLEPDREIGREMLFEKRTVLNWEKRRRPIRGRPW